MLNKMGVYAESAIYYVYGRTGIILAQDFWERKNPIWTKTVRDFQIQWDFFFARSDKLSEIFFFFFFVKARFCIRIVCISIIIAY